MKRKSKTPEPVVADAPHGVQRDSATTSSSTIASDVVKQRSIPESAAPTPFIVENPEQRDKIQNYYGEHPTREQLLYMLGGSGLPLDQRFFEEFSDTKEIIELAYSIALRRLVCIIASSATTDVQFIAALRLLANIGGKSTVAEPASDTIPAADKRAPSGVDLAIASVEKLKQLRDSA